MEAIHTAAARGDVDALRRELESGVSPDQVGPHSLVPLHFSAAHGTSGEDNQLACIRLLIDAGANVSAADDSNMSAILYAAIGGCPALMTALLDAGADPNDRDNTNWTPLHHAIYSNRGATDCMRLLINAGADADARCDNGRSPLSHCILLCESHLRSRRVAESERQRRLYPILLRAGALPPVYPTDAYLRKVRAAGGFRAYERNHLNALAATFLPKLPSLPPELVRRVVEYAFHVGDY